MPGTHATNTHQGSRSEYLATYAFTALGTVVPVPHQEDTGIDHYCTITENRGRVSIPKLHYCMQVKSFSRTRAMNWKFADKTHVEWLINHPSPLFLCVVNKAALEVRLYSLLPRFEMWSNNDIPSRLVIHLHDDSVSEHPGVFDRQGDQIHIHAPILRFKIKEVSDAAWVKQSKVILSRWIAFENENLYRMQSGVRSYVFPMLIRTNRAPTVASGKTTARHSLDQVKMDASKVAAQIIDVACQLIDHGKAAEASLLLSGISSIYADELASGNDGAFCIAQEKLLRANGIEISGHTVGENMLKFALGMCSRAEAYLKQRAQESELTRKLKQEQRLRARTDKIE